MVYSLPHKLDNSQHWNSHLKVVISFLVIWTCYIIPIRYRHILLAAHTVNPLIRAWSVYLNFLIWRGYLLEGDVNKKGCLFKNFISENRYYYKHETILHNINKTVIFRVFIKKTKAYQCMHLQYRIQEYFFKSFVFFLFLVPFFFDKRPLQEGVNKREALIRGGVYSIFCF